MQRRFLVRVGVALLAMLTPFVAGPAHAHPHVWVTVRSVIIFEDGAMTGVQHSWTFDEFYTAMAIEGLDKNGDGVYDRKELAELAQVNMDGLKDFDYFTLANLSDARLAFGPPRDYWLEHTKGLLTLHFSLPLAKPVPSVTPGFTLSVDDPSYFIAFSFAEKDPVKMVGAVPAGCQAARKTDEPSADTQRLAQAFGAQMDGLGSVSPESNTIEVTCGR